MNFSELFKQTGQLCCFSPDGQYLANVVQYRVIVRDVETLQILHLYTCLDAVQQLEWSNDSCFLLCGMHKRGLVQVWSIEQPEWTCKIDEGSAGLIDVHWSPDSRHILTTAEFHLRVTVWSLTNKSVSYIKYPKPCQHGMDFTKDGRYMAMAERRDCKDYVSVFDCTSWHLVKHIETETEDLAGLSWSPDSRVLAVWESCLQYRVLLYSMDGRCLSTFNAYDYALGVKVVSWAPSSQFIAIGSFDEKVRLLNHITWNKIVEFHHKTTLKNSSVVIYRETTAKPPVLRGETEPPASLVYAAPSKYELVEGNVSLPTVKADMNKANPKLGVGVACFSPDCRYLYTRNDNMPNTLWIWDITKLSLSVVLIQEDPIKCVSWDPCQARLALCTGSNKIYMWSPAGCLSVEVPTEGSFQVHSIKWHQKGNSMLLIGRDQMCMCFLVDSQ